MENENNNKNGDDKTKRSFDDILNDLNSLLDKMPDVIDNIKADEKKTNSDEDNILNISPEEKNPDGTDLKETDDVSVPDINAENTVSTDKDKAEDNLENINENDITFVSGESENNDHVIPADISVNNVDGDTGMGNEDEIKLDDIADADKIEIVKPDNSADINSNLADESKNDISIDFNINENVEPVSENKNEINLDPNEIDLDKDLNQTRSVEDLESSIKNLESETENDKPELKEDDIVINSLNLGSDNNEIKKDDTNNVSDSAEINNFKVEIDENSLKVNSEAEQKNGDASVKPADKPAEKSLSIKDFSKELNDLISMLPPGNIDAERIKNVGFIYNYNDEDSFKGFLKKVDDISLASNEKPMFVKRAFVMPYDNDFSKESLLLDCQNEKVIAVVLIGQLPMEIKYDIENLLSQNNIYFTDFNKENMSGNKIIDFIMELIMR
jgi:hypothetical protein